MHFAFVDATGFEGETAQTVMCVCHNRPLRCVRKHAASELREFQCRGDDHTVASEAWPDGNHRITCACHNVRIQTDGLRWLCGVSNQQLARFELELP